MQGLRKEDGYGDFGTLSSCYNSARKRFAIDAIKLIMSRFDGSKPLILDIGCGTGIATRQLNEGGGILIATDISDLMIRQAQRYNMSKIKYMVAPAEKQPFREAMFDAVTTFSAFHWFARVDVVDEVKRVLKPGGFFFVVNKNELGGFKDGYRNILKQFIDSPLPDAKADFNPLKILRENGFVCVEEKTFDTVEIFSPKEAIKYIQTVSLWNLVPNRKRHQATQEILKYIKRVADKDGNVERILKTVVVSGRAN
jgi:ubiquinone/menaquinone biosynthesis C-methylase UbiE